ncbi:MAG: DUF1824 family protein [Cyanobacteriota bacterium]|nr:DUF1824 family protein [Cyanobacteriota bacterium]
MVASLNDLRGMRTAPLLSDGQRQNLRQELQQRLGACDWFTIGVMASSGAAAANALRQCEAALGWSALELDPASAQPQDVSGPAFLKGNQNTGRFQLRPESGLGEGLLISGHNPADPSVEDTWGPLPLNFFD